MHEFLTKSYDIASECILFSRCSVYAIYTRKQSTEIGLCKLFVKNTVDELATVHECIRVMTTCISVKLVKLFCFILYYLSTTFGE